MAGRDPWTMRGGGILGELFPDSGQSSGFIGLSPPNETPLGRAMRELMARGSQNGPVPQDYLAPSAPPPWSPSALDASNSGPTQTSFASIGGQWPSLLTDSAGNPPPLPHELPYFASEPTLVAALGHHGSGEF